MEASKFSVGTDRVRISQKLKDARGPEKLKDDDIVLITYASDPPHPTASLVLSSLLKAKMM